MDKFLLKHDFVLFEQDYFSCDLSENNFYDLLDDLDLNQFITDLFQKKYLNNSSLDRIFKKNMHDLSQFFLKDCINFEKFIYFKSEADILHAYLFLFLIKTLSFKTKSFRTKEGVETSFSVRDYFLDRNDFINIFVDYLYKFFIFNEILHKKFFNLNKGFLRSFTFRFVEFCNIIGLISLKDLKTSNRHFKLVIFNSCRISFIPEVSFFLKKYDVYIRFNSDPYIYNNHFTSVVSITKQATYSNATFKIQSDQVNALTQRSFFIDRSLLTNNYKILLQSFSLSEQTDLSFLVEDFSLKILKFLNEGDLNGVRSYHSKLSSVLTLIRIKTILSMNFDNKKLHLPFMFCFRGRVYELSNLSFTFYKEFRFCLYSGIYDIEDELFHPINSQINTTLENYFYFFKKYDWFLSLNLIRKRACVWLFISLGVLKKTQLGKKVHISAFLLKGIEIWEQEKIESNFLDFYEKIEFNYILFLIEELKNSKVLKKWVFWKDATASCFQHLLLILGERDENSYKICNLNSTEYWYDPYSYLISDFFEKRKNYAISANLPKNHPIYNDSKYISLFSRERLKKVIMTESYGAGFKKLSSYFFLNLNLDNFSMDEKVEISQLWSFFFDYLSSENVLFSQSSKSIISAFEKKKLLLVTNPDNTEVDYSCFVIQITQNELYINKKRHTFQTKSVTTDFDKNQFNTSLRANFVQARDATLARKYITYTKMWTVHDCFSIDFLNITYMLSVVNELMNGEFYDLKINLKEKKPIYSIFIII